MNLRYILSRQPEEVLDYILEEIDFSGNPILNVLRHTPGIKINEIIEKPSFGVSHTHYVVVLSKVVQYIYNTFSDKVASKANLKEFYVRIYKTREFFSKLISEDCYDDEVFNKITKWFIKCFKAVRVNPGEKEYILPTNDKEGIPIYKPDGTIDFVV